MEEIAESIDEVRGMFAAADFEADWVDEVDSEEVVPSRSGLGTAVLVLTTSISPGLALIFLSPVCQRTFVEGVTGTADRS